MSLKEDNDANSLSSEDQKIDLRPFMSIEPSRDEKDILIGNLSDDSDGPPQLISRGNITSVNLLFIRL